MTSAAGSTAQLLFDVGPEDLAIALGSGDVPVLATPRLVAWMEAATVAALADELDPGATSVGTALSVEHLAACGIGARVAVWARVAEIDGRTVQFVCEASTGSGSVIGTGRITRAIVDRSRFAARWG